MRVTFFLRALPSFGEPMGLAAASSPMRPPMAITLGGMSARASTRGDAAEATADGLTLSSALLCSDAMTHQPVSNLRQSVRRKSSGLRSQPPSVVDSAEGPAAQ